MLKVSLVAAMLAASGLAQDHRNWGDADEWSKDPQFAPSKEICRRLGAPRPPARDLPTAAQAKALKGCDSEKLYYGHGGKPDYVRARQCAMIEAQGSDDLAFGGSTILMQVYANGLGVARNPDLATAYGCRVWGAPMELRGRIAHLQQLKTKPETDFDVCDDITSGMMMGQCAGRASRGAAVERDARLKAMVARLPAPAARLYPEMRRAFDAFLDAHGTGEVDLSGTARGAFVAEEQDKVLDQLALDLGRLADGRWPPATAAEARAADAQLNASYRKALTWAAGKTYTTIKPEDIRNAQRAWLAYRDAFARFAAASGKAGGDAVLARLTRLRTAQLDALPQD
jgi:hypothetical protein